MKKTISVATRGVVSVCFHPADFKNKKRRVKMKINHKELVDFLDHVSKEIGEYVSMIDDDCRAFTDHSWHRINIPVSPELKKEIRDFCDEVV